MLFLYGGFEWLRVAAKIAPTLNSQAGEIVSYPCMLPTKVNLTLCRVECHLSCVVRKMT